MMTKHFLFNIEVLLHHAFSLPEDGFYPLTKPEDEIILI